MPDAVEVKLGFQASRRRFRPVEIEAHRRPTFQVRLVDAGGHRYESVFWRRSLDAAMAVVALWANQGDPPRHTVVVRVPAGALDEAQREVAAFNAEAQVPCTAQGASGLCGRPSVLRFTGLGGEAFAECEVHSHPS